MAEIQNQRQNNTPGNNRGGPGSNRGGPGNNRGGPGNNRGGFRGGGGRFGRRPRGRDDRHGSDDKGPELFEKVIYINRSSKVVKGGRRFNFSALVVVGNREGKVGLGFGKAGEVASAIKKGSDNARNEMVGVSLRNDTIPHEVHSIYDGANILLKPACPGTGVIAGKVVRSVLDAAGVSNVLTKSLGSKNAANVAKATLQALRELDRKSVV